MHFHLNLKQGKGFQSPLALAVRQETETKVIQIRNEEVSLSLCADDIILHVPSVKSTRTLPGSS